MSILHVTRFCSRAKSSSFYRLSLIVALSIISLVHQGETDDYIALPMKAALAVIGLFQIVVVKIISFSYCRNFAFDFRAKSVSEKCWSAGRVK